jgi:hypothetical protein
MSLPKLLLVVAVALTLTALAVTGAAWKWTKPHPTGAGQERVAGWTWDEHISRHA